MTASNSAIRPYCDFDAEDGEEFERMKAIRVFWWSRNLGVSCPVPPQLVIDGGKQ
jgi:hypothetical protein